MIDADGYRPNVGIILCNRHGQVLWARRVGHDAWQFPQGGIQSGETIEQALYRELWEEIGLLPHQVRILGRTRGWLRYRFPARFIRRWHEPVCIGQKQKWFLLELLDDPAAIRLDCTPDAEFDHWMWASYWYPLGQVVAFKREVYRRALLELVERLPLRP